MHNPARRGRLTRHEQAMVNGLRKRLTAIETLNARIGSIVVDRTGKTPRFQDRTTRRFMPKAAVEALTEQRAQVLTECGDLYDKLDLNRKTRRLLNSVMFPEGVFEQMRKRHIEAKKEVL